MTPDIQPGTGPVPASDLIAVLRDKAPRAAMAAAAAQIAWPAARYLRGKARDHTRYTVKVPGSDGIYDELHEWVLGLLPERDQRALVAWSTRPSPIASFDAPAGVPRTPSPVLRLRYDGSRAHTIWVAGHKVRVVVTEGESGGEPGRRWKPPEITFTMYSLAGRKALLTEMNDALRRSHEQRRRPVFRMLDKWGDWESLDDLPARDLSSVILPDGQLEQLTADVGRFLASEQEYVRRCIPWHRGHLYEGPPGTGKTSVARAIASHYGMDVWYLPLADVKKDGELLRMVTRITPRSILLLEDVDVFHAATRRDDESDVTLSGLLNSLDGIATPHGLLTVLTSNTPEVLDPAVVRPGRIDLVEHFGYASPGQVARLVGRYYGQPVPEPARLAQVTPGAVIEACKRHDSAPEALAELTAHAPALNSR